MVINWVTTGGQGCITALLYHTGGFRTLGYFCHASLPRPTKLYMGPVICTCPVNQYDGL